MIDLVFCLLVDYRLLCPDYRLCAPLAPSPPVAALLEEAKGKDTVAAAGTACPGGQCAVPQRVVQPRLRLFGWRARR